MTEPPELFSPERPVRSDFARRRDGGVPYVVRRILTLAIMAGILIGGGAWLWHRLTSIPGEIPTVKAEGSYKVKPEQPGGIDIPHQDVQVYHEIGGGAGADARPPVEHMLPLPEEPNPVAEGAVIVPVTPAASPAPGTGTENLIQSKSPKEAESKVLPQPSVDASPVTEVLSPAALPPPALSVPPAAPVSVPAPSHSAALSVAPPLSRAAPAAIPAAKPPSPVAKDGVLVQLASFPDKGEAERMVQTLRAKYASSLGDARLHVTRADLAGKGVFYRVQSQPLTEDKAKAVCEAIKKQSAGCILVRP